MSLSLPSPNPGFSQGACSEQNYHLENFLEYIEDSDRKGIESKLNEGGMEFLVKALNQTQDDKMRQSASLIICRIAQFIPGDLLTETGCVEALLEALKCPNSQVVDNAKNALLSFLKNPSVVTKIAQNDLVIDMISRVEIIWVCKGTLLPQKLTFKPKSRPNDFATDFAKIVARNRIFYPVFVFFHPANVTSPAQTAGEGRRKQLSLGKANFPVVIVKN